MGKREAMSGVDTAWLRMEEPANLMTITALLFFDGHLDYGRFKKTLRERLLPFDRFRQRIVESTNPLKNPRWEYHDRFDLDAHLHRVQLPSPANKQTLQRYVGEQMGRPLDFSRPLWQMQVIDNYEEGDVLLVRLHHCMADGLALLRVLLSLTDPTPEGAEDEAADGNLLHACFGAKHEGQLKQKSKSALRRAGEGLAKAPKWLHPKLLARGISWILKGASAIARLLGRSPDPETPLKGTLGRTKRVAWASPMRLEDVKSIGRTLGGTVNDVLLTAMTGALRRYLKEAGEPVDDLDLRAAVPVNLRAPDAPVRMGNRFGLVFLSLPVGMRTGRARLRELKRRMDAMKQSMEALVVLALLQAVGCLNERVEEWVVDFLASKVSLVTTNVPGPREQRYLAGAPVSAILPWVPQAGRVGLGLSIISYRGEVLIGAASDEGLVANPERLVRYFREEFEDLLQEVPHRERSFPERCQALTKKKRQCKNKAQEGSRYCHVHQPVK